MRLGCLFFVAAFGLAACGPHVPFALSKHDQERFQGNVLKVNRPGHDPWIFGINDCIVYKAKTAHDDIVDWTVVLASDWGGSYPKWFTSCTRESIGWDGKYVNAFPCAQAIGAGGGCADGGDYRSRTGDAQGWQFGQGNVWVTLPDYNHPAPSPKPHPAPTKAHKP